MRVLIVRLDHLGDVILTTPLIRAAVKSGHETHVLVRKGCAPPIAGNPAVTTHTLEQVAPRFPAGWLTLGRWMRSQRFDTVILPYARPPQLLLASAISGAKRRIAMWGGILGRLTLHECLRSGMRDGTRHFADIPLDCARAAGFTIDGLKPDFFLAAAEIGTARADMQARFPGLKLVGIHPGCAGNTCNLPPAGYGRLAAMLLQDPSIAIIGTGIPSEQPFFDTWPAAVLDHPRFLNACGQWTLPQLAANIACFSAMVVPSTGPLHIAAALGIRTVSPFCNLPSISAAVWGNQTPGSVVINPPAAFCQQRRAAVPGQNCDFQGQISAESLCSAVLDLLASASHFACEGPGGN